MSSLNVDLSAWLQGSGDLGRLILVDELVFIQSLKQDHHNHDSFSDIYTHMYLQIITHKKRRNKES